MTTAATRQSARIPARSGFFRLPASGAYTIEVTSFEALSTGDYTLRLGRDDVQFRGRALASTAL